MHGHDAELLALLPVGKHRHTLLQRPFVCIDHNQCLSRYFSAVSKANGKVGQLAEQQQTISLMDYCSQIP